MTGFIEELGLEAAACEVLEMVDVDLVVELDDVCSGLLVSHVDSLDDLMDVGEGVLIKLLVSGSSPLTSR